MNFGKPTVTRPVRPAADPQWMQGSLDREAPQAKEGGEEGWLVSSWELRRGLRVRETSSVGGEALWSLWCEAQRDAEAQLVRSTSRLSAAPSSITAKA